MKYKDDRLAGTIEYVREYCEDSKDFAPLIENEAGVYELFLSRLEEFDCNAFAITYAKVIAYSNASAYASAYVKYNAKGIAKHYAKAYASAKAYEFADAKIKQLFIESIEEVNCGHN